MTHVIAEPCVNVVDQACVAVCPFDCIHLGGVAARGRHGPTRVRPRRQPVATGRRGRVTTP